MGGGGSLTAVGNILLKREGGWWGAKAGSGREMLGTGGQHLEPKHICQLSNVMIWSIPFRVQRDPSHIKMKK